MDSQRLNDEGRELWNRKAVFWDALHGDDGNEFHRRLVAPSVLELLGLAPGEAVLDVGCGNGALARRLAECGARVTAFDFSDELIRLAKRRSRTSSADVQYLVLDATDEDAMLGLGADRFDAVACAMALMDMPTIAPLFRAAARLLRDGGRFVFATQHPAFNSNNPIFVHEKEDRDGLVSEFYAVKLRAYLQLPPVKGAGAPGEPAPHYYYHRPLGELLGAAFAAGFVLDALLEPAFSEAGDSASDGLSWLDLTQIPPVLTGRLRLR
ncbi:MAG: class I SAM-dependent methyltransferase [Chloroflexi bacterium]|nr:class I SAM-dependent methyltransferase [Chloroflexota bacterium]